MQADLNSAQLSSGTGSALSSDSAPVSAADARYRDKAVEAAVKFEGFFIARMLHQMRSTVREMASDDSVFKDRVNSDMLDMADGIVADKLAGQRAFGIADVILRQLLPQTSTAPQANTVATTRFDKVEPAVAAASAASPLIAPVSDAR